MNQHFDKNKIKNDCNFPNLGEYFEAKTLKANAHHYHKINRPLSLICYVIWMTPIVIDLQKKELIFLPLKMLSKNT